MLFHTPEFFLFFLVVLFVGTMLEGRLRNLFLLGASCYFYAQWDVRCLALIGFITVLDFTAGLLIEKYPDWKKFLLVASVCSNLGILAFFKYYNFFMDAFAEAIGGQMSHLNILLPVGISFYTFESLSYTIDVYRGQLRAQRSIIDYALFISFFPHLVAGPIIRPRVFFDQTRRPYRLTTAVVHSAFVLFATGLFKKMVLADNLATFVDPVFFRPEGYSSLENLIAVYAFAFQIYFDFSGYTDMAIALAQLLGFKLPENFTFPYSATSLREFWRRWHISLSSWLRDYLYISLGGNRLGRFREHLNLLLTMLLGGLWHGANVTFLLWGGLHGSYLVVERLVGGGAPAPRGLVRHIVRSFVVFHLVCFSWILFRAPNVSTAGVIVGQILTGPIVAEPTWVMRTLVLCVALWATDLLCARTGIMDTLREKASPMATVYVGILLFGILIFAPIHRRAFIYFQF
jgi:alginate O-acetyltransferase complex protein AlgI